MAVREVLNVSARGRLISLSASIRSGNLGPTEPGIGRLPEDGVPVRPLIAQCSQFMCCDLCGGPPIPSLIRQ